MTAFQQLKAKRKIKSRFLSAFTFCLIFIFCFFSATAADFDFNAEVKEAYKSILRLRLQESTLKLQYLQQTQKNNLANDFLEDYIDFFRLFISEEKPLFNKLKTNEDLRLEKIEKTGNPKSPYTDYVRAEINLHWSLIYLKFGQYLPAFNRVKRAYHLLQDNTKKFPEFVPNRKSLGIIQAMLSTVPNEYKWILKTLSGMNGEMGRARFELEQVMLYARNNDFLFKEEAVIMYSLMAANFDNDATFAWKLMKDNKMDAATSPLITYIYAHLAYKLKKNDEAIEFLLHRPKGQEYFPFYFLDYLLGITKLRRLDNDAEIYLKKYIENHKGQHYIKDCYQKLAWAAAIKGSKERYFSYMQEVKQNGAETVDDDKQAMHEAENLKWPETHLLQARLLFDGGYYNEAEATIVPRLALYPKGSDLALEANYRIGRIYHQQKKYEQAIFNYLTTTEQGSENPLYFACASYLYIGEIYEQLRLPRLARTYFNKCLEVNPRDYASSLHQKAKSGIIRTGGE